MAHSWPKLARTSPPDSGTTATGGRLRMPRTGMIVKVAHHTAAISSEIRTASSVSSITDSSAKLVASSSPPPR